MPSAGGTPIKGYLTSEIDLSRRSSPASKHCRTNPEMGRIVPEFDRQFVRELIHPPFRIVYRREPKRVRIVRVWRSERLLLDLGDEDK